MAKSKIADMKHGAIPEVWMDVIDMGNRITSKPDVMGGLPCIAGTRIPVRAVQSFHGAGYSIAQIQKEYPTLSGEQICAAINYKPNAIHGGEGNLSMDDVTDDDLMRKREGDSGLD